MTTRYVAAAGLVLWAACAKAQDSPAEKAFAEGTKAAEKRDHAAAVKAFTEALKLAPKAHLVRDRRGDSHLKLGQFAEAVADFDAVLEVNPQLGPDHWRRGIALYYLGRHADGVKQFETHKTVNPQDVENAVWHYLCNVPVVGREKAAAALIDVTQDTRVPMAQVQKLYAGKLKPADVLAAAEKVDAKTPAGVEARFYGHLYVGLWHHAAGDAKSAEEHIRTAVEKYEISHYMWDVGKAHLIWLKAKK
jgi:lipoprotein NlpI